MALQDPALKRLYAEFQTLFRRFYPNVTSHLLAKNMRFEHDTRACSRAPENGGMAGPARDSRADAAMVPQTFDKRYFRLLIMASFCGSSPSSSLISNVILTEHS